jgi:hypothetical protein
MEFGGRNDWSRPPVLSDLCKFSEFNKRNGVRLQCFLIDDDEWALLEELWPLLDVSNLSSMKNQLAYHFIALSFRHKGSL